MVTQQPDSTDSAGSSPPSLKRDSGVGEYAVLGAILLVGIAFRAWLISDPSLGDKFDLGLFHRWILNLHRHGLGKFYAVEEFCDYPPATVLMFYGISRVVGLVFDALPSEDLIRVIVKIPAGAMDLMIGLLLFFEGRRLLGRRCGVAAAALFVLNPAVIYDSAYWGQFDSIYLAFVLLALVCVGRQRWYLAGAATAASLLLKFQAIALVPLILFEAYRLGYWRALGKKLVGALAVSVCLVGPFLWHGILGEALRRSYINVVGQYADLSKGAFNLWRLIGSPHDADTAIPAVITRIVSNGAVELSNHHSWLLSLNWRTISLGLYALVVAAVLSVYARNPGPVRRFGAAGLLALAFFLYPTEMHERYALAAIAVLPIWAISSAWRERAFFVLSALLLMNLAAVLPVGPISAQIGVGFLLMFAVLLWGLGFKRDPDRVARGVADHAVLNEECQSNRRPLIRIFQILTVACWVAALMLGGWIAYAAVNAAPIGKGEHVIYLSDMQPESVRQGWGRLATDHSVSGGMIRLNDRIFLKGLGTHAPSTLIYRIPRGYEEFQAIVGIDAAVGDRGSARISVTLDDDEVFTGDVLVGTSKPVTVRVPLQGAGRLTLRTFPTPDGKRCDHVDWALARFCKSAPPSRDSLTTSE